METPFSTLKSILTEIESPLGGKEGLGSEAKGSDIGRWRARRSYVSQEFVCIFRSHSDGLMGGFQEETILCSTIMCFIGSACVSSGTEARRRTGINDRG